MNSTEERHNEDFEDDISEDSEETSNNKNDASESSPINEHDNDMEYNEDDYKTSIENISIELQEFDRPTKVSSDDDVNGMSPGIGSEESLQKLGKNYKKKSNLRNQIRLHSLGGRLDHAEPFIYSWILNLSKNQLINQM